MCTGLAEQNSPKSLGQTRHSWHITSSFPIRIEMWWIQVPGTSPGLYNESSAERDLPSLLLLQSRQRQLLCKQIQRLWESSQAAGWAAWSCWHRAGGSPLETGRLHTNCWLGTNLETISLLGCARTWGTRGKTTLTPWTALSKCLGMPLVLFHLLVKTNPYGLNF